MIRRLLAIATALAGSAVFLIPQTAGDDDTLLRAMRDELARSRQLRVVGGGDDLPYFFSYTVTDSETFDVSASLGFGTRSAFKSELAAEICAVLGLSALQNHDKLGLMLFSDRVEKFLAETEKGLAFPLMRVSAEICEQRNRIDRIGHIGVHAQSQPGKHYIGVVVPVGRLPVAQASAPGALPPPR